MANQSIFKKLVQDFTEIVFLPYATQCSESLHTLHSAQGKAADLFQDTDLLMTSHSNIVYGKTLATGLINTKHTGMCKPYVETFSKLLKMCF